MIPDGTYKAVVDRFEDEFIVLEVSDEDANERYELAVHPSSLPEEGRAVDAVLAIEVDENQLIDAAYRSDETDERSESSQNRFDRLSRRPSRDE